MSTLNAVQYPLYSISLLGGDSSAQYYVSTVNNDGIVTPQAEADWIEKIRTAALEIPGVTTVGITRYSETAENIPAP